jgi:hypothetical protein
MPVFKPVQIDVPTGDHAAIDGSSVSWNSVAPGGTCGPRALDVISEYRGAEHEYQVMTRKVRDDPSAIRGQESRE